jgi:hypothetical protein
MILQYPHLKHKMLADFFGWLFQYQMLNIKYACSMKKNGDKKKLEIREKKN